MPTTAATIKHRTQITGTNNPGIQISKNPWNDSEIMAGGNTGGLCVRDSGQSDGWGLIDAVASGQVLISAGTSTLPTWTGSPTLSTSLSIGTSPASTGALRLAFSGAISWANAA